MCIYTDSVLVFLLLISHNSCVLPTEAADSSLFNATNTQSSVNQHLFSYHHTTAPCCAIKFLVLVINGSSLQFASVYEGIVLFQ